MATLAVLRASSSLLPAEAAIDRMTRRTAPRARPQDALVSASDALTLIVIEIEGTDDGYGTGGGGKK